MSFHWEFFFSRLYVRANIVSIRSIHFMQHQRIRASSHLKFQLNQLNRFIIGYWFCREFTISMRLKQFCTCILNLLRTARKVCRTPCNIILFFFSFLSLVCYLSDDVRSRYAWRMGGTRCTVHAVKLLWSSLALNLLLERIFGPEMATSSDQQWRFSLD